MTENHQHRHSLDTECLEDNCGSKRHEEYVHSHESGHDYHTHKPEGVRLIKIEEVEETESKPHSSIWHGDAT